MSRSIFSEEYLGVIRLLRKARKDAGLSQAEVACRLGQTQSFVSKCERGERRLDIVELLHFCKAVGADPHRILKATMHLGKTHEVRSHTHCKS